MRGEIAITAMPPTWMPLARSIDRGRVALAGDGLRYLDPATGETLRRPTARKVAVMADRLWVEVADSGVLRVTDLGRAAMLLHLVGDLSPTQCRVLLGVAAGTVACPAHASGHTYPSLVRRKLISWDGLSTRLTGWGDAAVAAIRLARFPGTTTQQGGGA